MPELVALMVPRRTIVADLWRAWEAGDAVFPVDLRLPKPAMERTLAALGASVVIEADGRALRLQGGRPVDPGDALVLATSGSTGEPKGVVLTHDAVRASALATSIRLGVTPADHWLACLPLSHVGGLSVVIRAMVTDTPVMVHPGFAPDAVEDAARRGATLVSLVSTAYQQIDPGLFRTIVLGGARPPAELPPNVVTTYGMTETGSGVVYDGVPLDGVDVRLDEGGQIHLRGPMLLRAYRDGTNPRDRAGWLPTGDVGSWAPDGRLVVHGRAGDLIITGGENVWPEPVEAILGRMSGVAGVAVAGVDDPTWGQRVVAFIEPEAGVEPPTLDAVRGAVREVLPAYSAPRQVVLVQRLPRAALGKVQRRRLAGEVGEAAVAGP